MRLKILILLLFAALGKAFSQGNSIYQVAPMPVCWHTPADRDSNLIAYWIFSPQQPQPKVVSYLVADGTQVVVSGGTLSNGFCCCNSSQDTIGITINGDTLILVQNGETYTYIGGGGADDDWRWVDPGADETMYEAIYRVGKVSINTTDTTHAFRVDSTFQFRTDGGKAIFDWLRGDSLVNYKTWMFRAPGGESGANGPNSITIASNTVPALRAQLGSVNFAAPYVGGGTNYRTAAAIRAVDGEGGNDTTNVYLDFMTRQEGETFMRNTMTIEGGGRIELDRYNLFQDGIPERFLGYENTDKDVTVHNITGNAQPDHLVGINSDGTGMEWKDPDTLFSSVNIYNSNGSIPAATTRTVTVPTDAGLNFTRGLYNLGYYTTGLAQSGGGSGWASRYFSSSTSLSEVFAGLQSGTPTAGIRVIGGVSRSMFQSNNTNTIMEYRNTSTNTGSVITAGNSQLDLQYLSGGIAAHGIGINNSGLFAYASGTFNTVFYPSVRPGVASFWQYNPGGSGQYVAVTSIGVTDLTFSGSVSPVTLNSSSGTDVTLTAGSGVTFSQAGNNLTINSSGGGGATDLGITGTSSPLTVTSSTGTDVTLTAGANVTLTGSGGNNATIAAADANLAFSGASSPVSLTSSTGTDVTIAAGTNVTLSQAANTLTINAGNGTTDLAVSGTSSPLTVTSSTGTDVTLTAGANVTLTGSGGNNVTIAATGDGNGIYGGSGNIPTATGAVALGSFAISSAPGSIYWDATTPLTLGTFNGNRYIVDATNNIYSFGDNIGSSSNAAIRLYNAESKGIIIRPPSVIDGAGYPLILPPNGGSVGEVLTIIPGGATDWELPTSGTTDLTFSGSASPISLNSSSGTDVTLTAGTGVTFSQAGNNLTINSSGGGATDLGITGTSSPLTVTSSTGTDVTLTAGANVTLTGSGGNNATIAAADANLAFSGASSPISLTSSTGTDVTIAAGTNVTLSQAANTLTINAGNGTTDLAVSGTSSPLTVTSSTGTDVTLTAGANVTLTGSGGNNVTIAATGGTTDLSFTGASSPVTLNSSSGTDVTITAGTGVEFSQAGNNLTLSITSAVNAIRGAGTGNTSGTGGRLDVSVPGLVTSSVCVCSGRTTTGPIAIYCTPALLGDNDVLAILARDLSTGNPVSTGTFVSYSFICYE